MRSAEVELALHPAMPDALVMCDGARVVSAEMWQRQRAPELRGLFEQHVYGKAQAAGPISASAEAPDAPSADGRAVLRQVAIRVGPRGGIVLHLLLWLPANRRGRVPVILGLNFYGNHSTCPDPIVRLPDTWMPDYAAGTVDHRATEAGRGTAEGRWPVQVALDQGLAVATLYHGDIDPDRIGFADGVLPLFYRPGQTHPAADEWGTLAAWAWGLSRAMDYFQGDGDIDARHVAVFGHSRNGKAALLAAAMDPRFALAISNQSGCGGAALFRGKVGERIADINRVFPHWFCDNFKQYGDREAHLPVDQHLLIALIAPRPVLVCSAADDAWADPQAELAGLCGADPVYRLLGAPGKGELRPDHLPEANRLCGDALGYHIRPGAHAVGDADWRVFVDFCTRWMA